MDIHTLHVEHVVLLAVFTLLSVANSQVHKGMKGIHWFSLYNLFALLGAVSVALRGGIPDILSIVLGNMFVVVGYSLCFLSVAELVGRRNWQLYLQAVLVLVAALTMIQTGYVHPDTRNRLIAYSAVLFCQQFQIALMLLRKKIGSANIASYSMGAMLAGLALSNVIRIAGVTIQGVPQDYLKSGPFLAWIVVANSCLQCGAMVAYVWLTASLLRVVLEVQAATDPLTGLLNRRAFEAESEKKFAESRFANQPISAVIIDLDDFKVINDTFGHHSGDATLVTVAKCLQNEMRKEDLLARIGGDEFAVVLPNTSLDAAQTIAERLRLSIQQARIDVGGKQTGLTASLGVAESHGTSESWDQLLICCDHALYKVKHEGGNLVFGGVFPQ